MKPEQTHSVLTSPRSFWGMTMLLLFGLVLVYFSKPIFERGIWYTDAAGGDVLRFHYPVRHFLRSSLKDGKLLLWTDKLSCGLPIHAEGEGGFFHPANLIFFWLLPADIAYLITTALSFLLAAIGVFLFASLTCQTVYGPFLAAVSFAFSGFFATHLIHPNVIQAVAAIPWILYFSERFVRDLDFRMAIFAGIFLACQELSGHPQFAYYGGGILAGHALFSILGTTRNSRREGKLLLKLIAGFLCIASIGVGLSAIQWLPTAEYARESSRTNLTFEKAHQFRYEKQDLLTLFHPNLYGSPKDNSYRDPSKIFGENCFYIGLLPLILSFIGMWKAKSARLGIFLTLMAVFSFLVVLLPPLQETFWNVVPGAKLFRVPQRILVLAVLSMATLAGVGLEKIFLAKKHGSVIIFFAIAFSILDLFRFGKDFYPSGPISLWLKPPETVSFLKETPGRMLAIDSYNSIFEGVGGTHGDPQAYRHLLSPLPENYNMIFGIPSINGNGGFLLGRLHRFHDFVSKKMIQDGSPHVDENTARMFGAMSLRWFLSLAPVGGNGFELRKRFGFIEGPKTLKRLPPVHVYENRYFIPKFFLVQKAVIASSQEEAAKMFVDSAVPPAQMAILEERPKMALEDGWLSSEIRVIREQNEEKLLEVRSNRNTLLVISETHYPGWYAEVDGAPTKILRANYLFKAIEVPKGNHRIHLVFKPKSFQIGALISLLTALFGSGMLYHLYRR